MTKAKKTMTVEEVRKAREENIPVVFNMIAALKAIEDTPVKVVKSGALGDFSKDIMELFKQAGTPLALNQVRAALIAGGKEVTAKQVADRCWLLAKRGQLKKGADKGVYELA